MTKKNRLLWIVGALSVAALVPLYGVPPDYFSPNGQYWGNPMYDWPKHEQTGYAWRPARRVVQVH